MKPPPEWIYIDVDGVLLVKGTINQVTVKFCKKQHSRGRKLVLWSMNGQGHAVQAARKAGISSLFEAIVSKPGCIVDNQGWAWIKAVRVVGNR